MKHLCEKNKLNMIPVLASDPPPGLEIPLRKYYIGKKRVTTFVSKYDRQKSTTFDSSLESRTPRFLASSNCLAEDEERQNQEILNEIQELENIIKSLNERFSIVKNQLQLKQEKNCKILNEIQTMRNKKKIIDIKEKELKEQEMIIHELNNSRNLEELKQNIQLDRYALFRIIFALFHIN